MQSPKCRCAVSASDTKAYQNADVSESIASQRCPLGVYVHVIHAEFLTNNVEAPRQSFIDYDDDLNNLDVNDSVSDCEDVLIPECFVSLSVGQDHVETTSCGMISGKKEIFFNEVVTIDHNPADPSVMYISMIDSSSEDIVGTCTFNLDELSRSEGGNLDQWFLIRTPSPTKSTTGVIASARFSAKGLQPSELKQNLASLKQAYTDARAIIRLHIWLKDGEAKPTESNVSERPNLSVIGRQRSEVRRPSDVGWHGMGHLIDEVVDDDRSQGDEEEEEVEEKEERSVVVVDMESGYEGESDTDTSEDDEMASPVPEIPAETDFLSKDVRKNCSIVCIADDLYASLGNVLVVGQAGSSEGVACGSVQGESLLVASLLESDFNLWRLFSCQNCSPFDSPAICSYIYNSPA
mmetsp:Transcript_5949/g.9143  ORF Transcript_5949/g.9143 Transcript_5949/m.9143 type:complete len:407 (-) Transcript_5949:382-1602(-)